MQTIIAIDEIKARAEAIGLSLKDIAKAAGVNPSTAYRGAAGKSDHRLTTIGKLSRELLAKEAERLKDLQRHAADRAGRP